MAAATQELAVFLFSVRTSGDGDLNVALEDVGAKEMEHHEQEMVQGLDHDEAVV